MRKNRLDLMWLGIAAALAFGLLASQQALQWGAVVSGQTVPRTPPPTWTRTPRATLTRTPASAATSTPTATFTLVPGAPTPVPQPQLWIALEAGPNAVGPGDIVRVACRIGNRGNAPAGRIEVAMPVGVPLGVEQAGASRGAARAEGGVVTWTLEALEASAEANLTVQARVPRNASPGQEVVLRARLVSEASDLASEEIVIALPWALLPATGG